MACLETCCCRFKLKTGTMVIGIFDVLSCLLFLIDVIQDMVSKKAMEANNEQASIIGKFVGSIFGVLVSALIIIGAAKGRKWLLLPYIILANIVFLIVFFILSSRLLFYLLSNKFATPKIETLIWSAIFVLHIYLVMVVINHFIELEENQQEDRSRHMYLTESQSFGTDRQGLPNISQNLQYA